MVPTIERVSPRGAREARDAERVASLAMSCKLWDLIC